MVTFVSDALQNVLPSAPKTGYPWDTSPSALPAPSSAGSNVGPLEVLLGLLLGLVFLVFVFSLLRAKSGGPLVLKRFKVDPQAASGEYIDILGRRPGLIAFLLSVLGIDPITVLKCNADRIELRQASLFGANSVTIPLAAVTGIVGGYVKPALYLATAMGLLIFGLFGLLTMADQGGTVMFVVALVLAVICVVVYALQKRFGLHVQNGGDARYGLEFYRSVIEGIDVDVARVEDTIRIINWLVLQATARTRAH